MKLDGDIQKLAAELKDSHSLLLFGRGYNYATALEAALKVCPCSLAFYGVITLQGLVVLHSVLRDLIFSI